MTARLSLDALPALPGALELAARGVESTLAPDNLAVLRGIADDPRGDVRRGDVRVSLLVDPQTSGGLLAGIPEPNAAGCLDALAAVGLTAAVVGSVGLCEADAPVIRLDFS